MSRVTLPGVLMAHAVRLSDLDALTAAERADLFRRVVADAANAPNGQGAAALARIRTFEARYEIGSPQLIERLRAGTMRETAEIAEWLFYLRLLALGKR